MKKTIGILLYLLIFFLTGYWVGKNPEFYKDTVILGRTLPKVFIEQENSLTHDLLERLKEVSHVDFEIIFEKPETADLWITSSAFLRAIENFQLRYHRLQNKTISPDFKLSSFSSSFSLPIAWKIENQKLQVLSLTAPIQNRSKQSKLVQMLIQSILSQDYQLILIQNTDWNTPLLTLDEMNIPAERKASAIRKHSLLKTKIE